MRLAIVASKAPAAREAADALAARYESVPPEEAEVIVALGGDGFMLRTLHRYLDLSLPVYGMKLGRLGFLMNQYRADDLPARIDRAHKATLYPLRMRAVTASGSEQVALAFNEVALLRQSNQAAHIGVSLNGLEKLKTLICDGVLVSTAAGSTAYNLSAYGPILPLDANVLALTPISPFRPRRWRGAILPHATHVTFHIQEQERRPVSTTADFHEVRDVVRVEIGQSREHSGQLLFDPEHNLEQRILDEQFAL